MSAIASLYQGVFKRTSTFVLAISVTAFAFERGFDSLANYIWESKNKGKLWKDIKHQYEK